MSLPGTIVEHRAGPTPLEPPYHRTCAGCGLTWPCPARLGEVVEAGKVASADLARANDEARPDPGTTNILGSLEELRNLDDHQPVERGTLTRCEVDAQLWPCSTIERARAIAGLDVGLLEMVDVGWTIYARCPEQLDPHPVAGMVVGYDDDEEAGRTYRVLRWKHGAPSLRTIAASDVEPRTIGMPNSSYIKDAYRRLALHVGKQKGSADGTEVRDLSYALQLAQSVA